MFIILAGLEGDSAYHQFKTRCPSCHMYGL